MSLKSGNFHKKWLMQGLKASMHLRFGKTKAAVYKEQAQAAHKILLTRTPTDTHQPF